MKTERERFQDELLEKAAAQGYAAEVMTGGGSAFSADVQNGEPERYSVSRAAGVGLRVQIDGRDGYAYTEAAEDAGGLIDRAADNARAVTEAEPRPMPGPQRYRTLPQATSPLTALSESARIELARELEQAALGADPRVTKTVHCLVSCGASERTLVNTCGLRAAHAAASGSIYAEVMVSDGGEVQTGGAFRMGADALDVDGCAREAVEDALMRLGAKPVASGDHPVLLRNTVMADLLTAFSGVLSAENAQKGRSLLAGKEGTLIAAPCFTLCDEPFHPLRPQAFDGEGVPCTEKEIVSAGVFTTLLYDLKTAAKAGCRSPGNASRPSPASAIGIAPTTLTVRPGADDLPALMERMGTGLLVTDMMGLHAGLNPVSGDFSLKAFGRRVENGRDVGALGGITLAGNLYELLMDVVAVGSDQRFTMPGGFCCASPSVLIARLKAAGE